LIDVFNTNYTYANLLESLKQNLINYICFYLLRDYQDNKHRQEYHEIIIQGDSNLEGLFTPEMHQC